MWENFQSLNTKTKKNKKKSNKRTESHLRGSCEGKAAPAAGDGGQVGVTGAGRRKGVVQTLEHGEDVSSCSTGAAEGLLAENC